MIKNLTELEIKIGERIYKFLCAMDAPLGEVHDAMNQMKGFVIEKLNEAHAAMQAAEKNNLPAELCAACPQEGACQSTTANS
jgi:ferredoxin